MADERKVPTIADYTVPASGPIIVPQPCGCASCREINAIRVERDEARSVLREDLLVVFDSLRREREEARARVAALEAEIENHWRFREKVVLAREDAALRLLKDFEDQIRRLEIERIELTGKLLMLQAAVRS